MAWMTAEAAVAVTAGVLASSIALVGFGLDSVIEFFAAAVVVWQLRGEGEERETRAVRLIGGTFFALALYLAVEGIRDLIAGAHPGQSAPGLAVAAAALIVMPLLAVAKRRTGRALGNRTLIADSAETAFCAFTSAATLLGVGLNAWRGLVVGRSHRGTHHRRTRGQGRPRSVGRRRRRLTGHLRQHTRPAATRLERGRERLPPAVAQSSPGLNAEPRPARYPGMRYVTRAPKVYRRIGWCGG